MKNLILTASASAALFLSGCASTTLKETWKSPTYQAGPVQKVAVIAVDERGMVRMGFENRFVRDLKARGQEAIVTHELMTLSEIKADKKAAADRLREAGADAVLIIRLASQANYNRSVRATSERYVGTVTGVDSYYGWYDYYTVAYMDMGTVWSTDEKKVYLDTSLYELKTGARIWSGLTKTVLKDDTDALVQADALTAMVVKAMSADTVVR